MGNVRVNRRLKEVTEKYHYMGQTTWYDTEQEALDATETSYFKNLFYYIQEENNRFKAIFYDIDWKKEYLQFR